MIGMRQFGCGLEGGAKVLQMLYQTVDELWREGELTTPHSPSPGGPYELVWLHQMGCHQTQSAPELTEKGSPNRMAPPEILQILENTFHLQERLQGVMMMLCRDYSLGWNYF